MAIVPLVSVLGQSPAPNKTDNLELPPPTEVSYKVDPWVIIAAKKSNLVGDVKWMIRTDGLPADFKVKAEDQGNGRLLVSVPPTGRVQIFAVGALDGKKMTEFIGTEIIAAKGGTIPPPGVPPPAGPVVPKGTRLDINFIIDLGSLTQEAANIVNDKQLDSALKAAGHAVHRYGMESPEGTKRNMFKVLETSKVPPPAIIILDPTGKILPAGKAIPFPSKPADVSELVRSITG